MRLEGCICLPELHKVLQIGMGWENYYLYRFTVDEGVRREVR
jgi:hypothetical protein